MGVDNFLKFLQENYKDCYKLPHNNVYDYIYIDMNHILHNCIYGSYSSLDFKKKIYSQLNIIFSNFIALKQIYLAIDGPTCYAKMALQRKRRTMNSSTLNIDSGQDKLGSIHLTPGTELMSEVDNYIQEYAQNLESKYKYLSPSVMVSASSMPFEGELKILNQMISNYNKSQSLDELHLVISNDSDMIVSCVGLKPIYNIDLLIRTKFLNQIVSIKTLIELHSVKLELYGIDNIDNINNIDKLKDSNLRNDFVMISLLMGNDYMPKIGSVNFINLWKTYIEYFTKTNQFITKYNKSSIIKYNKQSMTLFLNCLFKQVVPSKKKVYVKMSEVNLVRGKKYLEGLLWCLQMYSTGICTMNDFIYEYSMSNPNEMNLCLNFFKIVTPHSQVEPINYMIYPLLVFPKKCQNLVNIKYRHIMSHKNLEYIYNSENCTICRDYKHNFSKYSKIIQQNVVSGISDTNIDQIKEKYSKELQLYQIHNKKHYTDFTTNDINRILSIVQLIK